MIHSTNDYSKGFTLLEVLVALVVISVGALGIAAMQASAISSTHSSQQESMLASEARSISDAMAANSTYWGGGNAPATIAVASSVLSDSTLEGYSLNCSTGTCSGPQLAAYDLKQWGQELNSQVPGAAGQISCAAGSPVICTVQVSWKPKTAVAINGATQSLPASASTVTYTLTNQL